MGTQYTKEQMLRAIEAVAEEEKTGKQTRTDISQTLDQIDIMQQDRYIRKSDLEVVQQILHGVEDYLEIVSDYRRGII